MKKAYTKKKLKIIKTKNPKVAAEALMDYIDSNKISVNRIDIRNKNDKHLVLLLKRNPNTLSVSMETAKIVNDWYDKLCKKNKNNIDLTKVPQNVLDCSIDAVCFIKEQR